MLFKITMIWIISIIFLMISVISQVKNDTPYGSKRQIHKSPFTRNRFDRYNDVDATKPIVYRLDDQYFECTIMSNVSVDDGDLYEKSFTEVKSTTKLPASENRRLHRNGNSTNRFLEKVEPVGSRTNNGILGVGRDEKRENKPKTGDESSANSTSLATPIAVDSDEYDSTDTYPVSRRESDESNGTDAEDSNEYANENRDDFSDGKSHENERPPNDKNDTKDNAMLAAVQRDRGKTDHRNGSKSGEQDDFGYKSKDGSPTVWVNNNIRFKFILSSGGRLLNGSSFLVTDNKTNPSVTLNVEKFTGYNKTVNTL